MAQVIRSPFMPFLRKVGGERADIVRPRAADDSAGIREKKKTF